MLSETLSLTFLSIVDSEHKTPQATVTRHPPSSRANQSQSLEVTDNDDEPIGDRWDEEEDWGSLEVGFHYFLLKKKRERYTCVCEIMFLHVYNF